MKIWSGLCFTCMSRKYFISPKLVIWNSTIIPFLKSSFILWFVLVYIRSSTYRHRIRRSCPWILMYKDGSLKLFINPVWSKYPLTLLFQARGGCLRPQRTFFNYKPYLHGLLPHTLEVVPRISSSSLPFRNANLTSSWKTYNFNYALCKYCSCRLLADYKSKCLIIVNSRLLWTSISNEPGSIFLNRAILVIFDSIDPFKPNNFCILRLTHQLASIVSFNHSDFFIHSVSIIFHLGLQLEMFVAH